MFQLLYGQLQFTNLTEALILGKVAYEEIHAYVNPCGKMKDV
jgi:hypothetical protein